MLPTKLTGASNVASALASWWLSHERRAVTLVDRGLAPDIGQSVLLLCLLVDDVFALFVTDVALVVAAVLHFPVGSLDTRSRLRASSLLELPFQAPSDSP